MAQSYNAQGIYNEVFHCYFPEELTEQPNNSFDYLSSFVEATDSSLRFAAVLPMGGSAIANPSKPVPSRDSNRVSNIIANMTTIENMGFFCESAIVECEISLGGLEWCQ
jgi:hypothetical protein